MLQLQRAAGPANRMLREPETRNSRSTDLENARRDSPPARDCPASEVTGLSPSADRAHNYELRNLWNRTRTSMRNPRCDRPLQTGLDTTVAIAMSGDAAPGARSTSPESQGQVAGSTDRRFRRPLQPRREPWRQIVPSLAQRAKKSRIDHAIMTAQHSQHHPNAAQIPIHGHDHDRDFHALLTVLEDARIVEAHAQLTESPLGAQQNGREQARPCEVSTSNSGAECPAGRPDKSLRMNSALS